VEHVTGHLDESGLREQIAQELLAEAAALRALPSAADRFSTSSVAAGAFAEAARIVREGAARPADPTCSAEGTRSLGS
jgi:hypothetical protein